MTIFDVIRYPLSDIPTKEEFSRLPDDLLLKMFDIFGVRKNISTQAQFQLLVNHIYFDHLWRAPNSDAIKKQIKQARKAIAEYEPI
jgi:hypothetical protein